LEGTRHVNMALIAKLIPNYFFNPKEYPHIDRLNGSENDDFLFNQGITKGYGKIQFHDYNIAYNSKDLANINIFQEQIEAYKEFLMVSGADLMKQMKDFDFLLAVGEIFTLVAFGQLIIESAEISKISDAMLNQMFDVYVRDFSKYAVNLYSKMSTTEVQQEKCLKMVKKPVVDNEEYEEVLQKEVYSLIDEYEMNK